MLSILPFDIIALIVDIIGKNKDTNLLKKLALVSHSFLQICSKHLFATVELHDAVPIFHIASSKKGFIKLLKSRPDVVKYIRKLTYNDSYYQSIDNDDYLLSSILPNLLRTIPRLNCLTIIGSSLNWDSMDSSVTSALLHLMRLPTVNHIDLSEILNFPLSSLSQSVNLHRLDISHLTLLDQSGKDSTGLQFQENQILPKIHELHTIDSSRLTTKLLHAKRQDGQPAFNFMDLRRFTVSYLYRKDERILRYILQNAKLLENLHILVGPDRSLVGWLHNILSPSARTLKVLDLTIPLHGYIRLPLSGLCEELEAMAGHYMLEALSIDVHILNHEPADLIGSKLQELEKVLVKPGWSALRRVSFDVTITCCFSTGSSEVLRSLPDKYLSHLPKLKSIAFSYSTDGKCALS